MRLFIEKNKTISIYQQLTEQITKKIETGELAAGEKLPTVRELADQLGIARGTVKHAYEELAHAGLIKMTRGKGSFVADHAKKEVSLKERAISAVDALLDEMQQMNFSPQEMQMFFSLKLRERMEEERPVTVIFLDCNPEALSNMVNQLSVIPGIEIHKLLLSDAMKEPFLLDDYADMIITTSTHYKEIAPILTEKEKLLQVVAVPNRRTVADMARIDGKSVGIFCASETFSRIILKNMQPLGVRTDQIETLLFGNASMAPMFIETHDVIILPNDYLLFCSHKESDLIRDAKNAGKAVIRFNYQIDGGSFLQIQQKIEQIKQEKTNNR